MYEETKGRKFVIEILDFLLERGLLKKECAEGMDGHYVDLEKILKKYQSAKSKEFKDWLEYWAQAVHRNHIMQFPDNRDITKCTHEFCLSSLKTCTELEGN